MLRPVQRRSPLPAFGLRLVALLTFAATAGCRDRDGVSSYTVSKATSADREAKGDGAGEYRILGALYPADEPSWFFKLTGPAETVGKAEPAFDAIAQSVRFPNGIAGPPAYDVPAGWKSAGPGGMRADTVVGTVDGARVEVTVTGATGGGRLKNLQRWAEQVGMAAPAEAEWDKYTRAVATVPVAGLRVDVRGPKNPAVAMGGPFMKGR